jgi:adenylate cyclase
MTRDVLLRQGRLWAVGLGLTLLAVCVHLAGWTERLELLGYDFLVRHFSDVHDSGEIVHVDIDDDSLERVGSWPWPRDRQARVIRTLDELGARLIVMDIVWSEPTAGRVDWPSLEPYAGLEDRIPVTGELNEENIVRPDEALAASIRRAGDVILAGYYLHEDPLHSRSPLARRIADQLRTDFTLDAAALADRLAVTVEQVHSVLAGVKRRVARERVQAVLRADPQATPREVHDAILDTPFDRQTADRADVLAAYQWALNLRELHGKCPAVPAGLRGRIPRVEDIVPPLDIIAAGAAGVGFVTFTPDSDGRTRRVPLLVEWKGRLVEHLAFAAACRSLRIAPEDLSIDGQGDLRVAAATQRPAMIVPLDDQGQMLVNWHVTPSGWQNCFAHLPVTALLEVAECSDRMSDNEVRRQYLLVDAFRQVMDEAAYRAYLERYRRMLQAERQWRDALRGEDRMASGTQPAGQDARLLRERVERDQQEALELIRQGWAELRQEPDPQAPDIAEVYRRFEAAHRIVEGPIAELERVNRDIAARRERLVQRLSPLVRDRIAIVGYTATAVADMVGTPAYDRVPGVVVHSNVLNDFLQRDFRSIAGRPLRAGVIVLLGLLITAVTALRGPATALLMLLAVLAVFLAFNALTVFRRHDEWLAFLTATLLTGTVWAGIVILRYLTTDRQRRQLRKAVSQYVSPAMARRIADSAARVDLSPVQARVTCFFSDIESFTPISERLGPEGTRALLNPYLQAMSIALHEHEALINKFMGDGIFAFFNPPILPCPGHEQAACEAALASREALTRLRTHFAGHPLEAEVARLEMRVGIATGSVYVGDYGSENKMDYTCVGDTVNLSARLESANKQLGTRILVAGPTREASRERFHFRALGRVQVLGQSTAVPVFELLGRIGQLPPEAVEYAARFEEGVAAYAGGRWDEAESVFRHCLKCREDGAAARYQQAILELRSGPADAFYGALRLTQK